MSNVWRYLESSWVWQLVDLHFHLHLCSSPTIIYMIIYSVFVYYRYLLLGLNQVRAISSDLVPRLNLFDYRTDVDTISKRNNFLWTVRFFALWISTGRAALDWSDCIWAARVRLLTLSPKLSFLAGSWLTQSEVGARSWGFPAMAASRCTHYQRVTILILRLKERTFISEYYIYIYKSNPRKMWMNFLQTCY